jgi:glycine hydroxymethyltransferase
MNFFTETLQEKDKELQRAIDNELHRQRTSIELIASENIVSKAVLEAQGSILTNKYAEGYPGRRYYGGCHYVDEVELLAIERAKMLFDCEYANVQPHSGSQANQSVFLALASPGDTILGMDLGAGGHLTHGSSANISGKWFNAVSYGVRAVDGLIDYDQVEQIALEVKPKIIIAGGSAYVRKIDFARFREIADKVGAYLMADIAHYSGLIVAGHYPSPIEYAHVVTSTTHKTLRGPRGGIILAKSDELAKKLNAAIFPGLQGGPLLHVIAGKAVAFKEALTDEFKLYAKNVIGNAEILSETLKSQNFDIVTNGTDCHMVLVDLRSKKLTGKLAEKSLDNAGLTCNKNTIPFDPETPFVTSGIRLGTPAGTTRGFGAKEFQIIGEMIVEVLEGLAKNNENNEALEKKVFQKVQELCNKFPIY